MKGIQGHIAYPQLAKNPIHLALPALAELARQTLAARAIAPEEGALRPAIAIMERQVAAVIAQAGGRSGEAIEILRAATRDELALPAPLGLPIPPQLLTSLPYIVTILALVIISANRMLTRLNTPACLGQPFVPDR